MGMNLDLQPGGGHKQNLMSPTQGLGSTMLSPLNLGNTMSKKHNLNRTQV
jgi:hypothetical protein